MQMVKEIVVPQDLTKNEEVNQVIFQSLTYFLLFAFSLTPTVFNTTTNE